MIELRFLWVYATIEFVYWRLKHIRSDYERLGVKLHTNRCIVDQIGLDCCFHAQNYGKINQLSGVNSLHTTMTTKKTHIFNQICPMIFFDKNALVNI